jgi:DNA polymerase III sliding clamp (beta) subunit (PCNA family)
VAGQIKRLIDTIIEKRSKNNSLLVSTTRAKLMLKGINPDAYKESTPDDPEIIARVKMVAKDFGIPL